jgi:hypothetical protein
MAMHHVAAADYPRTAGNAMSEPTIIIGNKMLHEGQSMTVRVALNNFLLDLQEPDALGDDEHGRAMTALYKERLIEVLKMMQPEPKDRSQS